MQLYLDRHAANRDPEVFPYPESFDIRNIEKIVKNENEDIFSLLSHNRYEINAFSVVNSKKNPRKCPARSFSIFLQSKIIQTIYGDYTISTTDTCTEYREGCVLARPDNNASIQFSANQTF